MKLVSRFTHSPSFSASHASFMSLIKLHLKRVLSKSSLTTTSELREDENGGEMQRKGRMAKEKQMHVFLAACLSHLVMAGVHWLMWSVAILWKYTCTLTLFHTHTRTHTNARKPPSTHTYCSTFCR